MLFHIFLTNLSSIVQLIPRTITLDPNGKQLLQWPVKELDTLRGAHVGLSKQLLKKGDRVEVTGITPAQVCPHFPPKQQDKGKT